MVIHLRVATLAIAVGLWGCASTAGHDAAGRSAELKPPPCTTTASRIPSNDKSCSAAGRSYSSEDLDRTGATTAAGALSLLDPSITVQH